MNQCSSAYSPLSPSQSSSGSQTGSSEEASLWILTAMWMAFAVLAIGFANGCARTVIVSDGSPARIGPDAKARIYARVDGEWRLSESVVAIPEGWYLVPPRFVENDK